MVCPAFKAVELLLKWLVGSTPTSSANKPVIKQGLTVFILKRGTSAELFKLPHYLLLLFVGTIGEHPYPLDEIRTESAGQNTGLAPVFL